MMTRVSTLDHWESYWKGHQDLDRTYSTGGRLVREILADGPVAGRRVLEVGAGSGFMAALLAHRAQHVTTLEIDAGLAEFARANLRRAGVMNVSVSHADGSKGLMSDAPFDVIVLSGSVAAVPAALLAQLKVGGRLVAIVGQEPVMRAMLVTRTGEQGLEHTVLFDTVAQRLQGFDEPTRFKF